MPWSSNHVKRFQISGTSLITRKVGKSSVPVTGFSVAEVAGTLGGGVAMLSRNLLLHINLHFFFVAKLLLLPRQPPYTKSTQICCSESKYQRRILASQGPRSGGSEHISEGA